MTTLLRYVLASCALAGCATDADDVSITSQALIDADQDDYCVKITNGDKVAYVCTICEQNPIGGEWVCEDYDCDENKKNCEPSGGGDARTNGEQADIVYDSFTPDDPSWSFDPNWGIDLTGGGLAGTLSPPP